jgi:diguanylate cyclase (GGDEF)-like protein
MEAEVTVVPTQGDSRRSRVLSFFGRSHRQLVVLLVAMVVSGCLVVGITLTNLTAVQEPLDRADSGLLVASGHLQDTARVLASVSSQFQTSLALPPGPRAVAVAGLASGASQYQSAFDNYRKNAVGLSGEKALQDRFAKLVTNLTNVSLAFLGDTEVTAAQVSQAAVFEMNQQRVLVALRGMYDQQIAVAVREASSAAATTRTQLLVAAGISLLALLVAGALVVRTLRRDETRSTSQAYHNELEARLHRALEMAATEQDVFELSRDAIAATEPRLRVELLAADSSRAHLHRVVSSNMELAAGCAVASPTECPAAIHGQPQIFESSAALDACPYLKNRPGEACCAVCLPVNIAGRAMGVMHATAPELQVPDASSITTLELVARRTGERVSMLRAFARSEMQAKTDPLTGLLNRRSLEAAAQDLIDDDGTYVAAYADLDHFKILNDVHGHDTGDRALKLFARVLRDSVRPSDIPARYGGEEFVVVLPNCEIADAILVMERVRDRLAAAIRDGMGPEFTVSVGVAESSMANTFSETVDAADAALLLAKSSGRDRVIASGTQGVLVPNDPGSIINDEPHTSFTSPPATASTSPPATDGA